MKPWNCFWNWYTEIELCDMSRLLWVGQRFSCLSKFTVCKTTESVSETIPSLDSAISILMHIVKEVSDYIIIPNKCCMLGPR